MTTIKQNRLRKTVRIANIGLQKVAIQGSASTFVVKIATFAMRENVVRHPNGIHTYLNIPDFVEEYKSNLGKL